LREPNDLVTKGNINGTSPVNKREIERQKMGKILHTSRHVIVM